MNYVSASMHRGKAAAKDFQEQTQLVLCMAKKKKQEKKKNPEGQCTLSDADSLYCHANAQRKLEKRNKKTVKYDTR